MSYYLERKLQSFQGFFVKMFHLTSPEEEKKQEEEELSRGAELKAKLEAERLKKLTKKKSICTKES